MNKYRQIFEKRWQSYYTRSKLWIMNTIFIVFFHWDFFFFSYIHLTLKCKNLFNMIYRYFGPLIGAVNLKYTRKKMLYIRILTGEGGLYG